MRATSTGTTPESGRRSGETTTSLLRAASFGSSAASSPLHVDHVRLRHRTLSLRFPHISLHPYKICVIIHPFSFFFLFFFFFFSRPHAPPRLCASPPCPPMPAHARARRAGASLLNVCVLVVLLLLLLLLCSLVFVVPFSLSPSRWCHVGLLRLHVAPVSGRVDRRCGGSSEGRSNRRRAAWTTTKTNGSRGRQQPANNHAHYQPQHTRTSTHRSTPRTRPVSEHRTRPRRAAQQRRSDPLSVARASIHLSAQATGNNHGHPHANSGRRGEGKGQPHASPPAPVAIAAHRSPPHLVACPCRTSACRSCPQWEPATRPCPSQ